MAKSTAPLLGPPTKHELGHLGPGKNRNGTKVVPVPGETCMAPAAVS